MKYINYSAFLILTILIFLILNLFIFSRLEHMFVLLNLIYFLCVFVLFILFFRIDFFCRIFLFFKPITRRKLISLSFLFTLFFLVASFFYFNFFENVQADWEDEWEQDSWAGGPTSSVAIHPEDSTGWDSYQSADDQVALDNGHLTIHTSTENLDDWLEVEDRSISMVSSADSVSLGDYVQLEDRSEEYSLFHRLENQVMQADEAASYCDSLCTYCSLWPEDSELGPLLCEAAKQEGIVGSGHEDIIVGMDEGLDESYWIDFSDCSISIASSTDSGAVWCVIDPN